LDLKSEASRFTNRNISPIIAADVKRFSLQINTDDVFDTHTGSAPRSLRLTLDGLLDRTFGERPQCIKACQRREVRLPSAVRFMIIATNRGAAILWSLLGAWSRKARLRMTQLRHWVHGSAVQRVRSDAPKHYARGGGGAGVRPWRRMISAIFARSGGPPAAALITSADSRKYCGPIAAGVITQSALASWVP
jgi:hypothetical protein